MKPSCKLLPCALLFIGLSSCGKKSDPPVNGACPVNESRLASMLSPLQRNWPLPAFSYDHAGRLSHLDYSGTKLTYRYSDNNEMTVLWEGFGSGDTVKRTLDGRGLLTGYTISRMLYCEAYSYDSAGKLVRLLRTSDPAGIAGAGDSTLYTWQGGDMVHMAHYYDGEPYLLVDCSYDLSHSGDQHYVCGWDEFESRQIGWFAGRSRYAGTTSAHLYKEALYYERQQNGSFQLSTIKRLSDPLYDGNNRLARYQLYIKHIGRDTGLSGTIILNYACN